MKIYFPHKEMNGILKHFSRRDKLYFNNSKIFSYKSSGYSSFYYDFNAFYFESTYYWYSATSPGFISFCLNSGFADLEGYEIKASGAQNRPYKWSFSASSDKNIWFGTKYEEYLMDQNEVYFVPWNKGPARCFMLNVTLNTLNFSGKSDVKQLELFGHFIPNSLHNITNCVRRRIVSSMLFMIFLCLK